MMTTTNAAELRVQLNGVTEAVPQGQMLSDLLEARGVNRRMVAVEYNGEILPRHAWDATAIKDGDVLEVVQMVGGG